MTVPRTADLTIRGRDGRMRATVHWPAAAGARALPPLVFFARSWVDLVDVEPRETCGAALWPAAGIVVLCMYWRESRGYDTAVGDAMTAIEWVADHAVEIEADPGRLLVAGAGEAAEVVIEVVRTARDGGWPAIAHLILVDPFETGVR